LGGIGAGGWGLRINTFEPAGRVPPDALLFLQAPKKSKQKMAFSCGGHFLAHRFLFFYCRRIIRPEHYPFTRFTGPLPLAPALRCSAVVFRACAMASFLCSHHVTFKPSQKTTAQQIVVMNSES
jgi:hypothetical protein